MAETVSGAARPAARHAHLDGLALQFREQLSGPVCLGESDPRRGAARGERAGALLRFDVRIRVPDLGRFLRSADHGAELDGTVSFDPLGGTFPIRDGRFGLFEVDARTGLRQVTYGFSFQAGDGATYRLRGHKEVHDDPGPLDVLDDMTMLFTTLHAGEEDGAPAVAAGILRFDLALAPELLRSMHVEGASSLAQRLAAYLAFTSFAYGALRDEYLKDLRLVYDTRYENLVVSGRATSEDGLEVPIFLASGFHERGFPWGDGELFSDVLLAVGDGRGGFSRYALSDRTLAGLDLDVEGGTYRYSGPIFRIADGYSTSFSEMRAGAASLEPLRAEIEISFRARAFDAVPMLFPLVPRLFRKLSSAVAAEMRRQLPGEDPLGIFITPHAVAVGAGSIRLTPASPAGGPRPGALTIAPAETFGEAEIGTFRNVKFPTMLYGYLCALRPQARAARVQVHSRTLRHDRERWGQDRLEAVLGSVVSRACSSEILLDPGGLHVRPLERARARPSADPAPLLRKLGDPIVEVNNDHYPTAVFQRRIVEVLDPTGERCLALEEDMSLLRLDAAGCDRRAVVASIADEEPLRALDRALDATGFDALLDAKWRASGKPRAAFSVVVKPNFMFAYDRRDRSTYTDPRLVHRLVDRVRVAGFERIAVAEAQSTYGEYFDRRSVREMAEYLGYDGSAGYEVVDMSLDADELRYLGPRLGLHPVSRAWRDADFRVSFAKNKTHAYAYYTLTLKNVYGALPLANKFEEYHCKRDIYETAIEYLSAFPVDYGLVDAVVSADGPFGIFADPAPNHTRTILAGDDLVAVDWVAASKMGIDPMLSRYMRLAVKAFGKPRIRLVGDASPYRPWLNVPVALTVFTSKGLDADYHFGNLLYSAAAQMDEARFRYRDASPLARALRRLTLPLRRAFFVRTGEDPSLANRFFSRLFYELGF